MLVSLIIMSCHKAEGRKQSHDMTEVTKRTVKEEQASRRGLWARDDFRGRRFMYVRWLEGTGWVDEEVEEVKPQNKSPLLKNTWALRISRGWL